MCGDDAALRQNVEPCSCVVAVVFFGLTKLIMRCLLGDEECGLFSVRKIWTVVDIV